MLACLVAVAGLTNGATIDWKPVEAAVNTSLNAKAFPGATALVMVGKNTSYFSKAFGHVTYDAPAEAMTEATKFDLASLTKVIATTSATMLLYQRGLLDLDWKVSDERLLGEEFAAEGKENITVRNLLMHNAGLPPDPVPQFWSKEFACNATVSGGPPRQTFDCVEHAYVDGVLGQRLINVPGEKFVYSDLSMITMMFIVGKLVQANHLLDSRKVDPTCVGKSSLLDPWTGQCWYQAFVENNVTHGVGLANTGFLPDKDRGQYAPACVATSYRKCPMVATVSDGNAYALGGIAGHAGLFSSTTDLSKLLYALFYGEVLKGWDPNCMGTSSAPVASCWVNQTTMKTFTAIQNRSQSSRALGWDTNDHVANSYRGCGNLSSLTFTHTGYTGTQVCVDPTRNLITILLTNRCYPDDNAASHTAIHLARQQFNNAVMKAVDVAASADGVMG
jgi:CubicO group peptidase (beta-lactamase class C family)